MSVVAPALSSLWRLIEDSGLDAESIFLKYGVPASVMFDANARVSYTRTDQIMAEAAARSGDPFFGLKEAKYMLPTNMGALGFAWLASTTLRSAAQRLSRYIQSVNGKMQIVLQDNKGDLQVSIDSIAPSADAYTLDTANLAGFTRMCRFIYGDEWNPKLVTVAYPAPPDTSYYFEFFRCPVEFDAERSSIYIDAKQADEQLVGANKQLAQLNDHIVVRYLAIQDRDDIVNRVRSSILENLGQGSVNEAMVAGALYLSTRNLNRKLKAENTSFKKLLLEIRSELANQYISDATLTLTEISYLLGFSEISSFSRAYKRWNGVSPSEARKSHM